MAKLFPSSADVEPRDETRVIGIDSDDADDLLSALTSDTARSVLAALHDEPATPSEVATRVDTSLQNVQYHLGRLEEAGVVEVADTVYSEKGREMKVYAPADRALVVVAGSEEDTTGLRGALKRLLGGVGALGIASVLLDRLVRRTGSGVTLTAGSGGADGGEAAGDGGGSAAGGDGGAGADVDLEATRTADSTATTTAEPTATPTAEPTATTTESDGFGIAEATTTAEPETATATAEPAATQAATAVPTAEPTPAPTGTPTEVATETATAAATGTPAPTPMESQVAVDTVSTASDPLLSGLSPGALFFLGGTTVLVSWFVLWYLRR